jgi:hypothetical protein
VNTWRPEPGPWDGVLATCPDPYLVWAELTDWLDLGGRALTAPLIVELKEGDAEKFDVKLQQALGDNVHRVALPYRGRKAKRFTLRLPLKELKVLAHDTSLTKDLARFDLCAAVDPRAVAAPLPRIDALSLQSKVLLGVIDVGFPFAHPMLRHTDPQGAAASRVARWWSMDSSGPFSDGATTVGRLPASMGYGYEIARTGPNGTEKWLNGAAVKLLDESTLYEMAAYRRLRRRATHGAHVLDLLVGAVPLRSRIPLLADRLRTDPNGVPTWARLGDPASDPAATDLVLVEWPAAAIADSSGGWLGAHVLDAITWITEVGQRADRRIVTLSYGATVGPHDGSSILESALADQLRADKELDIVVAAGNSFSSRLHARLDHQNPTLAWRVPPDAKAPAFLQAWCRGAGSRKASVEVVAPGGSKVNLSAGQTCSLRLPGGQPAAVVSFFGTHSRGKDPMLLLAVSPTAQPDGGYGGAPRALAPAGDWTLTLKSALNTVCVDVYVARNDRDLGAPALGRASWIADDADEPSRHLRSCRDDAGMRSDEIDGSAARAAAVLRRRGTTNGVATLSHKRLHVASGYQLRMSDHTGYSASGNAGAGGVTRGPSATMVTDETAAVRGVRAAGVRGASVVRLVGTSAAAPQLARAIAERHGRKNPGVPRANPPSTPGSPHHPEDLFGPGGDNSKQPVADVRPVTFGGRRKATSGSAKSAPPSAHGEESRRDNRRETDPSSDD